MGTRLQNQDSAKAKSKSQPPKRAPRSPNNSHSSPAVIDRAYQIAQALKLRQQGLSYPKIGAAMSVDKSTAYRFVQDGLAEVVREPAVELVSLELARLDEMLAGVYDSAIEGDTRAIMVALKIMEHRNKLLGAETAQKGSGGQVMTDEQRRARLSEVFQRLADAQKVAESYGGN